MQPNDKEPGKYDDRTVATLPKRLQEEVAEKLDTKKLEEQYLEELKANQQVREFLKEYKESSVEDFLKRYAERKARDVHWGKKLKDYRDRKASQFYDDATEWFWAIQQKKLFNLQCQWRANQISLNEVEISADFDVWEQDIERCSFVEPVTEDEVDLLLEFADTVNEANDFDEGSGWQNYDTYKYELENDDDALSYPDWYDFYDMRRGTGAFLSLPDIRGKQENFYRRLFLDEHKRIEKENGTYKEYVPTASVPFVPYGNDFLITFIKRFEKPEIQDYMFYYIKNEETEYLDERYEEAVMILDEAEEDVPIEYHDNWKKGVIAAAKRYRIEEIKKCIPQVFRDYQFRNSTGIQHPPTRDGENYRRNYTRTLKDQIIQGRILNGEPGDLNF
jgi:hypothetical protein